MMFVVKQKTAYEMRISDGSADVCSSDLGMRVLYHDIDAKLPLGNAHATSSLKRFLAQVDVVTLHVPGGKETANLMDADAIAAMKPGSIQIGRASCRERVCQYV